MNRGMIILIVVGIVAFFGITNFVGKLKNDDDRLMNEGDRQKIDDSKAFRTDVVGNEVLVKGDAPLDKRIDTWKRSPLHDEYMGKFPDFSDMKLYIDDRVQDDELKAVIIAALERVEGKFFAGGLSPIAAKEEIDRLK